jgi:hypothetical protein
LTAKDLIRHATEIGLYADQFTQDVRKRTGQSKVISDVDSADLATSPER